MARMTLYRMSANDEFTIWQAQYAISPHQEEVKKESWFLEFVFEKLAREIIGNIEVRDRGDGYPDISHLEWTGWTEVWQFAGEMDWNE